MYRLIILNCFSVTVISRTQWGAAAPIKWEHLKGPAQRVVIHHTALPKCTGLKECLDHVLNIQKSHMMERKFDDIGYK